MAEPTRTLGLYQPYAQLMLHGKIETRWVRVGHKPPFPLGPYLIYSCLADYTLPQLSQIAGHQYPRIIEKINGLKLLHGVALCVAELEKKIWIVPGMDDETFVRYQPPVWRVNKKGERYKVAMAGLVFKDVKPIKPFHFKAGKQGVGFLTKEDEAKIEYL